MAEHTGVDQLIQYADGQLADVLGAQVVQNQQVGLLAGIQPGVFGGTVKVFAPQLSGQRGGAGVQHIKPAVQNCVCNGKCHVGFSQPGTANKHQAAAFRRKAVGVPLAVGQHFAHVVPRGATQLRLRLGGVAVQFEGIKAAQGQRACGVDLLPPQGAGCFGHAAAGTAVHHAGILAGGAGVVRNKTLRPKAQRGISSCQALVCRFQRCGCDGLVRAAGGSQRQGQPGVGAGVLGGAQLRVGSQRCGTVTLGCCYGLLAAGRNVAQCFAEEFIFGAHGLSLRVIVKNIIPVGLEQVGFGGGWLCPGGQNVAARQLALTAHRRYRG